MKLASFRTLVAAFALAVPAGQALAQGVTTSSISGVVTDEQQLPIPGASVVATHEPSGSKYETTTRPDGSYSIPGMRVGGPY
ncbi:MAG TPA: carboxypeptidase-like regulatory domain-containing protein, partial [Vicinamibacteria bacterium]|nr:carboxypeptidase-like regulatory domain-containing protein [Vicinamibacteria bacterium]